MLVLGGDVAARCLLVPAIHHSVLFTQRRGREILGSWPSGESNSRKSGSPKPKYSQDSSPIHRSMF